MPRLRGCLFGLYWAVILSGLPSSSLANDSVGHDGSVGHDKIVEFAQAYCLDCHSGPDAEARLDLDSVLAESPSKNLRKWRQVAKVLADHSMPPDDADQPTDEAREFFARAISTSIEQVVREAARDPGPTLLRRLTNAEYQYAIEDLTGVHFDVRDQLVADSVGASGFTNAATGQFMQADTLERYLETAKVVASQAMVGAGPLFFAESPGSTGMELTSIRKIQEIYRTHGFRSGAGEGAQPFGTERFATAFEVAWRHRHRHELGTPSETLEDLARTHGLPPRFARHIWDVLQAVDAPFPLSELITRWQSFPPPTEVTGDVDSTIQHLCEELDTEMRDWQERFAGSSSSEEEKALLTWNKILIPESKMFLVAARRKLLRDANAFTLDLNDPTLFSPDGTVLLRITVEQADHSESEVDAAVVFENPEFQFRMLDLSKPEPVPLRQVIPQDSLAELELGHHPSGESLGANDFVVVAGQTKTLAVELPDDCRFGTLMIHARLDEILGRDRVVRCVIEDITNKRVQSYSSLLMDNSSAAMRLWQSGLETFATALPQISHREPTPSDRDPIPPPYDAAYNTRDRNLFHTSVKYHRDDAFLVRYLLPADAAKQLDLAWTDLLTSFDYHDVNFRFALDRIGIDRGDRSIEIVSRDWIESLPDETRAFASTYKSQYDAMQQMRNDAQPQHLRDLVDFARRAWRRPVSPAQQQELLDFYHSQRNDQSLNHPQAVRATVTRILVSPQFLYRLEHVPGGEFAERLSDLELASRLSFALWSSVPDERLLSLAEGNRLSLNETLSEEVHRLLASPKSRRMAEEFFGQWLGFYQFDQHRGVDTIEFPEFDDDLKSGLLDESVSYFEYMIRNDRPYQEIFDADYAFLNQTTAAHYGIQGSSSMTEQITRVEGVRGQHRGGALTMGSLLTTTSAPLRTSPVKRGDWVLRRLLGTPVPPPPADVGSIPAEEVTSDGMTARDQLEAHRNHPQCMNCHVRIDPLGFALENFDSLGRWRTSYRGGGRIDASGQLQNGDTLNGLADLKEYLATQDKLVRRMLAERLVAYVLGRAETVHDSQLIDLTADQLRESPSLSAAILTIARSPQFQQIRGQESADEKFQTLNDGDASQ